MYLLIFIFFTNWLSDIFFRNPKKLTNSPSIKVVHVVPCNSVSIITNIFCIILSLFWFKVLQLNCLWIMCTIYLNLRICSVYICRAACRSLHHVQTDYFMKSIKVAGGSTQSLILYSSSWKLILFDTILAFFAEVKYWKSELSRRLIVFPSNSF